MALLKLAADREYVRPTSPTHAARCDTTPGKLALTAKACAKRGWLRPGAAGKYTLTAAGRALVPTAAAEPEPTQESDEEWLF